MNGVQEIEHNAFHGCHALSDLDFDRLEIIGNSSFMHCESLKTINLPFVRRVEDSAFAYCRALTDAVLGEDLEGIGCAFLHCPS